MKISAIENLIKEIFKDLLDTSSAWNPCIFYKANDGIIFNNETWATIQFHVVNPYTTNPFWDIYAEPTI